MYESRLYHTQVLLNTRQFLRPKREPFGHRKRKPNVYHLPKMNMPKMKDREVAHGLLSP